MNMQQIISNKVTSLAAHTAAGAGSAFLLPALHVTFQAVSTEGAGTLTTATIDIQASNDQTNWVSLGTITLTGDGDVGGFASNAAWKYVRSNATTFTEAVDGVTVTVTMGA